MTPQAHIKQAERFAERAADPNFILAHQEQYARLASAHAQIASAKLAASAARRSRA